MLWGVIISLICLLCSIPIGGEELLAKLEADANLVANASAKQGLTEMTLLFQLLKAYKVTDRVSPVFQLIS